MNWTLNVIYLPIDVLLPFASPTLNPMRVIDNNVPTKNGRPIFSMFIQYPWQTNMNFELPLFRFKLKC